MINKNSSRQLISSLTKLALGAALTVGVTNPAYSYNIFRGEDINNSATTRLSSTPNANQAQTDFLANLVGVGTEDFESFVTGSSGLNLSFNTGSGTTQSILNGNGSVATTIPPATNGFGRYSISGDNFYTADAGNGNFSIDFDNPVAAFGFYGIDIGDFGGTIQFTVTKVGGATEVIDLLNTEGSSGSTDGSVMYFGMIAENASEAFESISFALSTGGGDVFAFDDMTIGSLEQVAPPTATPEPASLLGLLAVGSFGAASFGKNKQKKA